MTEGGISSLNRLHCIFIRNSSEVGELTQRQYPALKSMRQMSYRELYVKSQVRLVHHEHHGACRTPMSILAALRVPYPLENHWEPGFETRLLEVLNIAPTVVKIPMGGSNMCRLHGPRQSRMSVYRDEVKTAILCPTVFQPKSRLAHSSCSLATKMDANEATCLKIAGCKPIRSCMRPHGSHVEICALSGVRAPGVRDMLYNAAVRDKRVCTSRR